MRLHRYRESSLGGAAAGSRCHEAPMKFAPQLEPLLVPIADLHADPANVRLHGERNIAAIAASLARFGQQKPIVVQRQGMVVRAGNGTLLAAQQLGWTHIAASVVEMTDTEATAFSIADNRTAELAEWQTEDLLAQLEALGRDDAELLKATGFDQQDLDAMAAELGQDTTNELDDPGPEAPPVIATSRVGDIWVMGDHRLQCGDSTNAADVARLLSGEKPALLSTDPPYCVDYTGAERPQDSGKDWSDQYHEVDIKDLGYFLRATFQAGLPHLQDDAGIYVWHAHLQYPVIDRVFEEFGILRHQPIIWSKASSTFAYSYYGWAHETCLFGWKQGYKPPHYLENGLSTIWDADWEGKARNSTFHPTSKT